MAKTKKRKRIIIPVIVILAGGFIASRQMGNKAEPEIKTAKVERGMVTSSVSATGILQPLTTVDVKSNVGGRVDEVAVDVGDEVSPGQLLAVVDPTDTATALNQASADLEAANARVNQARESLELQRVQTRTQIESAEQALEAARLRLAQAEEQAKAQPALTRASIQQAQANYDSAEAVLKQLKEAGAPQRSAQAKAGYDQALASFRNADKNYRRQKELLAKGFVSQSQVDTAEAQYENASALLASAREKLNTVQSELQEDILAAEARVAQAKASLESARANAIQDRIKAQDLAAARAAVRQAQASLVAARANARQIEIKAADIISARSQVERSKAQVHNARVQLGYTRITAPREGIILKKYVEVGSIINSGRSSVAGTGSGTSVFQIGDTSRMFALVNVDETDIAQIEIGQMVDIMVDAYPSTLYEGKVVKIDPQAVMEQNVTSIPVTVEVDMPDPRLKPGMNVTCDFITDRKENVLMVPNEAVKEQDEVTTVTILKDGKQIERKVEVGIVGNEYSEIVRGLKEGEVVITAIIEPVTEDTSSGRSPMSGGFGSRRMGRF